MFRRWFAMTDLETRGTFMRALHSRWLSRALRAGSRHYPRIPTRLVSEGGFAPVMRTPEGQAWAQQFWNDALGDADSE